MRQCLQPLGTEAPDPSAIVELRSVHDVEGQVTAVIDALGRACQISTYSVDGRVLRQQSIDAGTRWALANVLGRPFSAWDALGRRFRVEADALQRPTHVWVHTAAGDRQLITRVLYGESFDQPETHNLRGKTGLVLDGAGLVTTTRFDFKGHALTWSRRLALAITSEPGWTAIAHPGGRRLRRCGERRSMVFSIQPPSARRAAGGNQDTHLMELMKDSTLVLFVHDIFSFAQGVTVFVGRLADPSAAQMLASHKADLVVDGQLVGTIRITAERSQGRRAPGLRAVETRDQLDVESIRGRPCQLVVRI